MKIIGLSGYARSGKDTLASFMTDAGWERRAFADKLKDFLYAQNPMVAVTVNSDGTAGYYSLAALVDSVGWERAKEFAPEHPYSTRQILQRLGTEAGRRILGENVWVDAGLSSLEPDGKYVFTDIRFPNEAKAIEDRGGWVFRIVRPGTEPMNAHPSETALDNWPFYARIVNSGTLEDLREIARSYFG